MLYRLIAEDVQAQELNDEYENVEDSLVQANITSSTSLSKKI